MSNVKMTLSLPLLHRHLISHLYIFYEHTCAVMDTPYVYIRQQFTHFGRTHRCILEFEACKSQRCDRRFLTIIFRFLIIISQFLIIISWFLTTINTQSISQFLTILSQYLRSSHAPKIRQFKTIAHQLFHQDTGLKTLAYLTNAEQNHFKVCQLQKFRGRVTVFQGRVAPTSRNWPSHSHRSPTHTLTLSHLVTNQHTNPP